MGLSVINRATLDRRFSAGTHSADDQVEWLNNSTVIDTHRSGSPQLFNPETWSEVVIDRQRVVTVVGRVIAELPSRDHQAWQ